MRLPVSIYKYRSKGCTNGGISDHCEEATAVWDETADEIRANPVRGWAFVLIKGFGSRKIMAIGLEEFLEMDAFERSARSMFGGNFIYTSDSRFPSESPIHIHDRFED